MHLWERLCQLPEEYMQQVQLLYNDQFPLVVRSALAAWIEEKPWYELDETNTQHENYALTLVNSLIAEIQSVANQENNFVIKVQLNDAAQLITRQYLNNPFALIHIVKQCLQMELKLIEQIESVSLAHFFTLIIFSIFFQFFDLIIYFNLANLSSQILISGV